MGSNIIIKNSWEINKEDNFYFSIEYCPICIESEIESRVFNNYCDCCGNTIEEPLKRPMEESDLNFNGTWSVYVP